MTTSLFDLYKIGIGPSSSHTMGPMRAACRFARDLEPRGLLGRVARVRAELYGSLALTGLGHATDRAVLLGLAGNEPAAIDPASIDATVKEIRADKRIVLAGTRPIHLDEQSDLLFLRDTMFPPGARIEHPNGLRLTAFDSTGVQVEQRTFFSIGGGFITEDGADPSQRISRGTASVGAISLSQRRGTAGDGRVQQPLHQPTDACQRVRADASNGICPRDGGASRYRPDWRAMQDCVARGIAAEGILPGGLNVRRRAHRLAARLQEKETAGQRGDPLAPLDWVTVYAMAVNEENAAVGRVVTAPTNGAAGVVPAVAHYYRRFVAASDGEGIVRFFLTSAAIGILYKENASISGAEVGCQGEVGVACSMAAGGLTAALGGSNGQVEHAAEIAMEHNLGMTCDPIGGLVQIPCIERNAMGAAKAVQASRIALNEPVEHKVSLDQVIRTMYLTGLDMQSRYKETSLAGLALNRIEC